MVTQPRIAVAAMCFTPNKERVARCDRVLKRFADMGYLTRRMDDDGVYGNGENARRSFEWAASVAAYAMVIQDDVEPCIGCEWAADRTSRLRPNDVLTFMDWTAASERAREAGNHWLVGRGVYGCATLIPSPMVAEMMRWINHNVKGGKWIPDSDDYTIGMWLKHGRAKQIPVYTPVPCIFQHAEPSTSTLGHGNKNRVCRWMVGESGAPESAYDVDWSEGIHEPISSASLPYDPKTCAKWLLSRDSNV